MNQGTQQVVKTCPSCGAPMEPEELVRNCDHCSQWWRCSNAVCLTKWLLPIMSGTMQVSNA